MTCCVPTGMETAESDPAAIENDDAALNSLSRKLGDGTAQLEFAVPDAHCAACIRTIETALRAQPAVRSARVNLSKRRVRITYDPAAGGPSGFAPAIKAAGYHTFALDPSQDSDGDPVLRELLWALGVAGFAAGNIMLFSVSIWSGANEATRDLFHWISALIALPSIAYAGRIFFRSAWRSVRVGKTNMDVPISIGVILATGLSLFETIRSGDHAYFDGTTMLLFFLLIGRALDHLMRERARDAISGIARLQPRGGTAIREDGAREYVALDEIRPGMRLEVRAGERVPVDSLLLSDSSSFDNSIVTGESLPQLVAQGGSVIAGAASLEGPVMLRAERAASDSFLARMAAMMDAAESAKTRPRRLADRAASVYAPIVHTIAIATFLGWLATSGGDWHLALTNAVAVLIITCPCALALAVPIVHVVAAGRLFERGVLMKDGAALEKVAEIDSVAFDKTGTLTQGRPQLVSWTIETPEAGAVVAAMAASSTHPLSRVLARELGGAQTVLAHVSEVTGKGVQSLAGTDVWRLGSASFCGIDTDDGPTSVWLTRNGKAMGRFVFEDSLRPEARETIESLSAMRLPSRLLSGDTRTAVAAAARAVGIDDAKGQLTPEAKLADAATGRTLMVGDGLNDAPAMRAAYVSMAPSSAADIGRSAADFVFTSNDLRAVPFVVGTARAAARMAAQNLGIAIGYNAIAVPLAVSGQVTPLIAAVAMSASSLIVVANALRLRWLTRAARPRTGRLGMLARAAA